MRCVNKQERTIWQFCYRKKQIDVSFSWVCPVIDNQFRHNIAASWIHTYFDNVMNKITIKDGRKKNWRQFVKWRRQENRKKTEVTFAENLTSH